MSIKIKGVTIWATKPLNAMPANPTDGIEITHCPGSLQIDLADKRIEDPKFRESLPEEVAWLSIGVLAGDQHLGDLRVNVQFEGKRGQWNPSMDGHNKLLLESAQVVREFLEELDGDFEVAIDSSPCPEATVAVDVARTVELLDERQHQRTATVATNRNRDRGIGLEHTPKKPGSDE